MVWKQVCSEPTCENASFFVCTCNYRLLILYRFSVVVHQCDMFHSRFIESKIHAIFHHENGVVITKVTPCHLLLHCIYNTAAVSLYYVTWIGHELYYSLASSEHCTTRIYKYTICQSVGVLRMCVGGIICCKTTVTSFWISPVCTRNINLDPFLLCKWAGIAQSV